MWIGIIGSEDVAAGVPPAVEGGILPPGKTVRVTIIRLYRNVVGG